MGIWKYWVVLAILALGQTVDANDAAPDKQIVAFKHDLPKLTSVQAGLRWSALALRPPTKGTEFDELLPALPSPEAWPTIEKELDKKGNPRLQLFASTLRGDKKKQRSLIVSLIGKQPDD